MQSYAGDPQYAPWNQHMRCECHECTQARYAMSQTGLQYQNALGGGMGILGSPLGISANALSQFAGS